MEDFARPLFSSGHQQVEMIMKIVNLPVHIGTSYRHSCNPISMKKSKHDREKGYVSDKLHAYSLIEPALDSRIL